MKKLAKCRTDLNDFCPKATQSSPKLLNIDGEIISDPANIADNMNTYFTNIVQDYVSDANVIASDGHHKLQQFVNSNAKNDDQFAIPTMSADNVEKALRNINPKKATGMDGIHPKFLKMAASEIAPSLAYLFNFFIREGHFPSMWKIAKVAPIFKSGDKTNPSNYRPISVLPTLSKILERHIHNNFYSFLTNHNLIYDRQSGFRAGHSTETALTKLVQSWTAAINEGKLVGAVFIDLRKAFDLVNHDILLEKLSLYKCNENAMSFFRSYLTTRSQNVVVDNRVSSQLEVDCGVPQGSILGPLFFILFINDLPLYVDNEFDMYADDSTLHTTGKTIESLEFSLQRDLEEISTWCRRNKMVINPTKTKAMLLTTRQKRAKLGRKSLDVDIDGNPIQMVEVEKLLGIHIDQHLTWDHHIHKLSVILSSKLRLFRRLRFLLPQTTRKLFFNSYILPHFNYCDIIWGSCNATLMDSIFRLQKQAARLILNADTTERSSVLFAKLKWQPLRQRIDMHKAVVVFKILNGMAPTYLSDLFTNTHTIHSRSLRSSSHNNIYPPRPRLELFKNSFAYTGSILWNALPQQVKSANTLSQFKSLYSSHARSQAT
jgi:hypothetical protein